jgi:tRNA pseudouridine55 synthase
VRRRWRDVDGIVLLDKPGGLSSNQALQRVRRLLLAAKGGHAGTLDPMATGMLPLCFGQATKACGQLLGSRKAYRARLKLGSATDTGDAEGTVVREAPVPEVGGPLIEAVLRQFLGSREQLPPMYSALKREGRPLYELAREGREVTREPRRVHIERLELTGTAPGEIEFEAVCSMGTYVRVLGEEIAAALGTCGHLSALRRLWVEPFAPDAMVSMETIERWAGAGEQAAEGQALSSRPPWLQPVDSAFSGRPRIDLDPTDTLHLRQGRVLAAAPGWTASTAVRAYGADGRFLGLVTVGPDGTVQVERLFVGGATGESPAST